MQPDEESCRYEILHARVYGLDLSKGIARAEIVLAGLKKNRVRINQWWSNSLSAKTNGTQKEDTGTCKSKKNALCALRYTRLVPIMPA